MRITGGACMNRREDHRNIEFLGGASGRRDARSIVLLFRQPVAIELAQNGGGIGTAPLRLAPIAICLQPRRSLAEGGGRNAKRVVMETEFLLPEVEAGFAPMIECEFEISAHQCRRVDAQWRSERHVARPAQYGEQPQRRTVMLRAPPLRNIQAAVGIDARIGGHCVTVYASEFRIVAQITDEVGVDIVAPGGRCRERAAVQLLQREAEAHEIREMPERLRPDAAVLQQQAQRIDHHGRIPKPMKKIIGIGIVTGQHRRGDHGACNRAHRLTKTRPRLYDVDRRYAGEHCRRRMAILLIEPAVERRRQRLFPFARWGDVKPSRRNPCCTSGTLMNKFHKRPLR